MLFYLDEFWPRLKPKLFYQAVSLWLHHYFLCLRYLIRQARYQKSPCCTSAPCQKHHYYPVTLESRLELHPNKFGSGCQFLKLRIDLDWTLSILTLLPSKNGHFSLLQDLNPSFSDMFIFKWEYSPLLWESVRLASCAWAWNIQNMYLSVHQPGSLFLVQNICFTFFVLLSIYYHPSMTEMQNIVFYPL